MNRSTLIRLFTVLIVIAALLLFFLWPQIRPEERSAGPSLFEQLAVAGEDPVELIIETDMAQLLAGKEEESYQPASIIWPGIAQPFEIELRPRGITRRKICDFPPLKLNFNKKELKAAGLYADYDKLKLVSECQFDEKLLLREYLAYRLYNEMTEHSFRAHLVRVRYLDTKGEHQEISQYGIILEPDEEMADRLQAGLLEGEQELRSVNADQYRLLTVFQYMIGNTDWNLSRSHNIRLISPADGSPIPVPYDFDYAGLVNAPYATPHPQIPISNVRERFFQWRGKSTDGLDATLTLFKTRKDALMQLIDTIDGLDEATRQDARQYLESFFQIIESEKLSQEKLFVKVSSLGGNNS